MYGRQTLSTALTLRKKVGEKKANVMLAKSILSFSKNLDILIKYYRETTPEKWNGEIAFQYLDNVLENVSECYISSLLIYQLRATKALLRKSVNATELSIEMLSNNVLSRFFEKIIKNLEENNE